MVLGTQHLVPSPSTFSPGEEKGTLQQNEGLSRNLLDRPVTPCVRVFSDKFWTVLCVSVEYPDWLLNPLRELTVEYLGILPWSVVFYLVLIVRTVDQKRISESRG